MSPVSLPDLPITGVLPDLLQALKSHRQVVLEAPPGAGKTTLVPLALLNQDWLQHRKILMLEPRRMAARAAAERMASLLGEPVGRRVGYRVRQATRVGDATRLEVITGGVFTRWLQEDPSLEGVGLVIFDEFHERHLDSDLGLALSLQGRELFRDAAVPLGLLVMSATLDGDAVAQLLGGAPVVRSQGRQFPVEVIHGKDLSLGDPVAAPVGEAVMQALHDQDGSILVFLPGQMEIQQTRAWLDKKLPPSVNLMSLHGGLTLAEQSQVIAPAREGARKVVLATDVAESSLTIEGVRVVVDAGRKREPIFDPVTGMTRLTTRRVSQASSTQRCGRAGRMEPGICIRLWSEHQHHQLASCITPEILQADLAPLALQLLIWGVDNPAELDWLDPPPEAAFQQALGLLRSLDAAVQSAAGVWQLTAYGARMSQIPAHPRLAHLLLSAHDAGLADKGAAIAAILSDPPRLSGEADMEYPLALVTGDAPCPPRLKPWLDRTRKQAHHFKNLSRTSGKRMIAEADATGYLLACAYPDRIARRREGRDSLYQLSNGRSAFVGEADPLASHSWLACAEVGGFAGRAEDRIMLAAPLNPRLFDATLNRLVSAEEVAGWDHQADRFVAEKRRCVGALTLDKQRIHNPDPQLRIQALLKRVKQQGLAILPWTGQLRQWQARVQLLRSQELGTDPWPDVSDSNLLNTLDEWLVPYLDTVQRGADLQRLNLGEILQSFLSWSQQKELNELAPAAWQVPSGSMVPIDYLHDPPVLAVKLQEMFGCRDTPRVAGGRIPLSLHLLSPARRPLQITQDIAGFWHNSYNEVKREMRGRYPKHPWPEDPLEAAPTKHTKALQRSS